MREYRGKDYNGMKYGEWLIIGHSPLILKPSKDKYRYHWESKCSCGTIKYVDLYHMKTGKSKSCGCIKQYGTDNQNWTGSTHIPGAYW